MQRSDVTTVRTFGASMAVALAVAAVAPVASAQQVEIVPLARGGRLLVSFAVRDAFTPDVRDSIQSGLPTEFTYELEVRRAVPLWFDRTIADARMVVKVRYDNLMKRYQVTLTQDGRVEEVRITDDPAMVQAWATEFRQLPFFSTSPLEANGEYYIRVRGASRPRALWFFWPWQRATVFGSAKFTFLP